MSIIELEELEELEDEEEEKTEEEEMSTSYTTWTHKDETVGYYLKSIAPIPLLTAEEEKILTWKIWRSVNP